MKHQPRCVTQCWMLLAVGLAAPLIVPARAADSPAMGTLSGKVVDPDGRPVASARIWTEIYDQKTSSRKLLAEARTDAEGRFRLGPVEPVYRLRYGLRAKADGFADQCIPSGNISIFPGRDNDLGTIQLDRGRVFTGRVLDFDGKPLPGAKLTAESYWLQLGHTIGGDVTDTSLSTDDEGRFRTPPLPVGHLLLAVRFPDRVGAHFSSRPILPGGEEDLGTIRLEKDVPVSVIVTDELGRPVSGVKIVPYGGTTDAEGRSAIRGLGPSFSIQLRARKDGYALINRVVKRTEQGFSWKDAGREGDWAGPFGELAVTMKRAGWIEGQAVDADTGEPVRLERVVVCNFERRPGGEVVLRGCRSDFEQTEPGRFRASFPAPDEYHLTFSAAGYHDAEAYTPKVSELKTIGGIVARMKKKTEGSTPAIARQSIAGTVTRDGRPVETGWVVLWALGRPMNAPNSPLMRGRTAVREPRIPSITPIRDGSYTLDVPYQDDAWYVVAEEPGYPLTQVGPIAVALNEKKTLDIACTEGGRIRGRVKGVPPGWEGHVWVVAFSKTAVREEARVAPDGTFSLPPLPPGEYGLKVGHDAYDDPEVYPGRLSGDHPESFDETADPWKRAKVVRVEAGQDLGGVEVEMPQ